MTQPPANDHGAPATADAPFPEAEITQLHASDVFAGKMVVSLMVGIFFTGLVLYSVILVVVTT